MKSSYTKKQIIRTIKQHKAGAKVDNICQDIGIFSATFYTW